MRPEDFPAAIVDLWPENVLPNDVFLAMGSQWRVGMAGATGLDYGALPAVLKLMRVPKGERIDVFDCLRVMEAAALRVMHARGRSNRP